MSGRFSLELPTVEDDESPQDKVKNDRRRSRRKAKSFRHSMGNIFGNKKLALPKELDDLETVLFDLKQTMKKKNKSSYDKREENARELNHWNNLKEALTVALDLCETKCISYASIGRKSKEHQVAQFSHNVAFNGIQSDGVAKKNSSITESELSQASRKSNLASMDIDKRKLLLLNNRKSSTSLLVKKAVSKRCLQDVQECMKSRRGLMKKSNETELFLYKALHNKEMFQSCLNKLGMVIDAMYTEVVSKDVVISEENKPGEFFFCLERGEVRVTVKGEEVSIMKKGDSIGEMSVLFNSPWISTCTSTAECKIWKIEKNVLCHCLEISMEENRKAAFSVMSKIKFFEGYDEQLLSAINLMDIKSFKDGEIIFKRGDVGDAFYVVEQGTVIISDIQGNKNAFSDDIELSKDSYFGELSLISDEKRSATVTAKGDCVLFALDVEDFKRIIGSMKVMVDKAIVANILVSFYSLQYKCLKMNNYNLLLILAYIERNQKSLS